MTRRTLTLTAAAVSLVALLCVALLLPVPYVALRPGPTRNVLGAPGGEPIVQISGHKTFPTNGSLSLTTVSVTPAGTDLKLPDAFRAWFSSDDAIVPRDAIYDPDQSAQQSEQQSATQMSTSQEIAAVAALRLLGDKVTELLMVLDVQDPGPSAGSLQPGDRIVAVDGTRIASAQDGQDALQDRAPGEDVDVTVLRDGTQHTYPITTAASPDDDTVPIIGISIGVDYRLPFDVSVNLGADIGGPSAGTIFALAIYDKLTPGSLTGGTAVAGTGEIGADGTVEQIGGIQQKIVGAANGGASVFLVPAANCEEAAAADVDTGDIELVRVADLSGAVDALHALATDPDADVASCA